VSDVTQILVAIDHGDPSAARQLLPLVYDELRKLAAARLAHEKPGQTLNATALVHEAYLRVFGNQPESEGPHWDGRRHFFAAAAEAMRRILIDNARRKKRLKHGGERHRVDWLDQDFAVDESPDELLALDEALTNLATEDPVAAKVVSLRVFTGMSIEEVGEAMGLSRTTAYRHWNYARAWLRCAMEENGDSAKLP
jgi:RNA polymerase sigma factor (TIGR02999 family)